MIPTIIIAENRDIIRNYYQSNYELNRQTFSPNYKIIEVSYPERLRGLNYGNQNILLLHGWKEMLSNNFESNWAEIFYPFLSCGSMVVGDFNYICKADWEWFYSFTILNIEHNTKIEVGRSKKIPVSRFELMEIK